jgi:serine kinase of HPr protein (carbohydrate metabolism regulator)
MTDAVGCTVHGTCVVIGDAGILIRGGSGTGKSNLALRLIDDGARLVSDDQVRLRIRGGAVIASAPDTIKGMIKVNGIGLTRLDDERIAGEVPLALLVDLVGADGIDRLPRPQEEVLMGARLPRIALSPFEASAPAKLRLAAGRGTGSIIPVP